MKTSFQSSQNWFHVITAAGTTFRKQYIFLSAPISPHSKNFHSFLLQCLHQENVDGDNDDECCRKLLTKGNENGTEMSLHAKDGNIMGCSVNSEQCSHTVTYIPVICHFSPQTQFFSTSKCVNCIIPRKTDLSTKQVNFKFLYICVLEKYEIFAPQLTDSPWC